MPKSLSICFLVSLVVNVICAFSSFDVYTDLIRNSCLPYHFLSLSTASLLFTTSLNWSRCSTGCSFLLEPFIAQPIFDLLLCELGSHHQFCIFFVCRVWMWFVLIAPFLQSIKLKFSSSVAGTGYSMTTIDNSCYLEVPFMSIHGEAVNVLRNCGEIGYYLHLLYF